MRLAERVRPKAARPPGFEPRASRDPPPLLRRRFERRGGAQAQVRPRRGRALALVLARHVDVAAITDVRELIVTRVARVVHEHRPHAVAALELALLFDRLLRDGNIVFVGRR